MITISRRTFRSIHQVFRAAFGSSAKKRPKSVVVQAGPAGLHIFASTEKQTICYHEELALPPAKVAIPWSWLRELESNSRDPVLLVTTAEGQTLARWHENAVPQVRESPDTSATLAELPAIPEQMREQPREFIEALATAVTVTDDQSLRFALGCLQLRGTAGDVSATNGKQLYRQRGFEFPFAEDLLAHASPMWKSAALADCRHVSVGATDSHLVVQCGPWIVWLKLEKEARYPRLDDVILSTNRAAANLCLHESDAQFLQENLQQLPGQSQQNQPVYLELQDEIAVRGVDQEHSLATEIRLTNSRREGDSVCIKIDRRYLAQALELGLRKAWFYGNRSPMHFQDERQTLLWAVLEPDAKTSIDELALTIVTSPVRRKREGIAA